MPGSPVAVCWRWLSAALISRNRITGLPMRDRSCNPENALMFAFPSNMYQQLQLQMLKTTQLLNTELSHYRLFRVRGFRCPKTKRVEATKIPR